MKHLFFLIVILVHTHQGFSQALQSTVKVAHPKLQKADPKIFKTLEAQINDFLNDQAWSDDQFDVQERIQCNFLLTITEERSNNQFKANLSVQATRPVYGSNYLTPIFTFQDKEVAFEFEQSRPLQFTKNVFYDNLSSILAFYAYIIVGLDYDSYGLLGGEEYFGQAQNIINTLPSNLTNDPGWTSVGKNRTRYWLVENLLSARVKPLRQAYYQYHRMGLDMMHQDTEEGKSVMLKSVEQFGQVNRSYPNNTIVPAILGTKSNEIVEVFKQAEKNQKTKVFQVMSTMDPSNVQKYSVLRF